MSDAGGINLRQGQRTSLLSVDAQMTQTGRCEKQAGVTIRMGGYFRTGIFIQRLDADADAKTLCPGNCHGPAGPNFRQSTLDLYLARHVCGQ